MHILFCLLTQHVCHPCFSWLLQITGVYLLIPWRICPGRTLMFRIHILEEKSQVFQNEIRYIIQFVFFGLHLFTSLFNNRALLNRCVPVVLVSFFNVVVRIPMRGRACSWQVCVCRGLWKFLRIIETCLVEVFGEKVCIWGCWEQ